VVFKDIQLHSSTMRTAKDQASIKLIKLTSLAWKWTGRFAESKQTAQKSKEREAGWFFFS